MQFMGPFRAKIIQIIGLLAAILMVQWLVNFPELVQRIYTQRVFVWITKPLRWISGSFHLSIGELVYIILIINIYIINFYAGKVAPVGVTLKFKYINSAVLVGCK